MQSIGPDEKKSKHVEFPVPTDPFKRVNIRP